MSNPLSVRRVKVQTIDAKGNPVGNPSFGVMAADSYRSEYNDIYESLESLNRDIEASGCILDIVDEDRTIFEDADREKIGTDNFYGKDWEKQNVR